MPPRQDFTAQETLELIDAKAKSLPERPLFYVKVMRKAPNGVLPQQIAAFSDARLDHFGDIARWLILLAGGGNYVLRISHIDSAHQDIGGPLFVDIPTQPPNGVPMRAVDASATNRPDWPGPTTMVMPTPVPFGTVLPPTMPPAVRDIVFQGTPYAGGFDGPQPGAQFVTPNADMARREAEVERAKRELDAREANLRKDVAEKEARVRDERLLGAFDAKSRELDLKLARITELQAQPKQESSSWVKELVAAMVPLVTQMLTMQHDVRMLVMKQSTEQNAAQMAAAERSHQQMLEFMKAAATPKQTGMSEEMKMLLTLLEKDKSSNGAEAMAMMTTRMLDGMSMVTKNSISMMEAMAEQLAPAEEHPAVAAIREGVKAIGMMNAGMKQAAQRVVQQQQPNQQVMPSGPVYVQVPQQQRPQQQSPQPHARAAPQPRPPPVATVQSPADVAVQQPQQSQPMAQPQNVQILENGIRQLAPIEQVAKFFVELVKVKDNSLFAALEVADGDPEQLVLQRLGVDFVAANSEYLGALMDEVDRQGDEAGVTQMDDEPGVAPVTVSVEVPPAAVVAPAPLVPVVQFPAKS